MHKSKAMRNTFVYIFTSILAIIFLFPILWVVLSSFKSGSELFVWPPTFFPKEPTLDNYIFAFNKGDFALFFKNSAFVAIMSTILTLIINTMAGYAFAKYRFPGRDLIFMGFIATLMLPQEVLMIPIFQVIKHFHIYNSFLGLIIPPAATPAGVFLMRQFFLTVPDDLIEAARIDGASEVRIFARLMLPLAKPAVSVLAIFSFMWRWNDYIWPLIVIRDSNLYTVQLALSNFRGQNSVDWNSLLAMSVVTMVPVLIVFLIFQKQFIKGMVTSGMKE